MVDKTSSWPEEDRGTQSDPTAEGRADSPAWRISKGISMDCYRRTHNDGFTLSVVWCIVNNDIAMTECGYAIVGRIKRRVPTCPECLAKVAR